MKHFFIPYAAVFNCFRHTVVQEPFVESFQELRIYKYCIRMIEASNKVFALLKICGHFASYAAVYLSQQRCGNLHIRYATKVC
ncbi:hypothetical protein SDC9_149058 [bioreactor metagenome]|uniref:Uncharacterized protein n=1 Tax=bioreactor metagenome TaxID=1076179 RepID=A0A645EK70_9ZZZZ